MKLKDRIKNATKILFSKDIKSGNPFTDESFRGVTQENDFRSTASQLKSYETLEWVSICTDNLSRDAGNRAYYFTDLEGTRIDFSRVSDAILEPLVNGFFDENFGEMMKRIVAHKVIAGNAFFLKAQDSLWSLSENIYDQFIPIFPNEIKPLVSLNGKVLLGYQINLGNGGIFNVGPDMVIHFKQNANLSLFWGIGNVTKMRLTAQGEAAALEYQNEFIVRKASPSLVITSDDSGQSTDDYQRKIDMLRKKYQGKQNAGKLMYLEGDGIKAQTISLSQKDMQFLEQKEHNRQTTISMFGQNPFVVGIPTGVNRATAIIFRNQYLGNMVNTTLVEQEAVINKQHVWLHDRSIKLVFEKYTTGDMTDVAAGIKNGIYSPSRGAELLGEPKDETDEAQLKYLPSNLVPMGYIATEPEPTEAGKAKVLEINYDGQDLSNPKNVDAIVGYFLTDLQEKGIFRQKKFQAGYIRAALKSRNTAEDKYYQKIVGFFLGQKKRILRKFDDMFDVKADIAENPTIIVGALFDDNLETNELIKDLRGLHTSAVQRAVADINKLSGNNINTETSNPVVKATIDRLGQDLKGFKNNSGTWVSINGSTKKDVARIITKGVDNNLSINEISDNISNKFDQYSGYRARRIARTESRAAWDASAYDSYKELDVETVDVVGCDFTSVEASYGTQDEIYGDCGKTGISITGMLSLDFHPNHIGVIAPSKEI